MHRYCAFGLTINSELEFPELLPLSEEPDTFDVTIQAAAIPATGLSNPAQTGLFYQTAPGRFWLNVPEISRFEVESGSLIRYQPAAGADEATIRLYLLGSCFGALLHQCGLLVMHGSAIRFHDSCVMFAGPSGNGKSTIAAALHNHGFAFLSDDVCAIDSQQRVIPGYPQLKLWLDTARKLEFNVNSLRRIRLQIEKYALKTDKQFVTKPLPIAMVYFLSMHNLDPFLIENITGMDTFAPLRNNTYRPVFLDGLGLKANHLLACGRLAGKIKLARITRPNSGFRLEEMVDVILRDLADRGIYQPDGQQPGHR